MFMFRILREVDPAAGGGSGDPAPVKVDNVNLNTQPPAYVPPNLNIQEIAPPEYRTKEYLKEVKDVPGLFKRMDELQTKLGQRVPAAVPGADAKPEDVQAFYSGLKPKTADEYKFEEVDPAKPRDAEVMKGLRGVFHSADISQHQAAKLLPGLEKFINEFAAGKASADDAAFETEITKQFGDQTDAKLKAIKQLMGESIPQEYLPRLNKLPNDALLFTALMYDKFAEKYIKEDTTTRPSNQPSSSSDVNALRARGAELIKHPAYNDTFHAEHDAVRKEASEVYQKIAGFESLGRQIKKS